MHSAAAGNRDHPSVERGGHVVLVALEVGGTSERLRRELRNLGATPVLLGEGGEHTRDACRAGEAEAAAHRDL